MFKCQRERTRWAHWAFLYLCVHHHTIAIEHNDSQRILVTASFLPLKPSTSSSLSQVYLRIIQFSVYPSWHITIWHSPIYLVSTQTFLTIFNSQTKPATGPCFCITWLNYPFYNWKLVNLLLIKQYTKVYVVYPEEHSFVTHPALNWALKSYYIIQPGQLLPRCRKTSTAFILCKMSFLVRIKTDGTPLLWIKHSGHPQISSFRRNVAGRDGESIPKLIIYSGKNNAFLFYGGNGPM